MKRFLKPLKFNIPENNIFFWGCLHLNHDPKWEVPLWKARGFDSIHEHNQYIKRAWRETLNDNSIIFLLGDTCFGYNAQEVLLQLFDSVPFKECYLLPGNHTAGWKQLLELTDSEGLYKPYGEHKLENKSLYLTPNYIELIINGHSVVLSHYPIASWNGQGRGSYMLHAHVHGTLEKSDLGKLLYLSRIKEVSFEKCPKPVSFNEVKKSFDQSIITFDHHGSNTTNPF